MLEVPTRELKARLGKYLRAVRRGERVAVTNHGQVVAEVVPPGTPERPLVAPLTQPGMAAAPRHRGPQLPTFTVTLKGKGPTAAQMVIEGRK